MCVYLCAKNQGCQGFARYWCGTFFVNEVSVIVTNLCVDHSIIAVN